MSGPDSKNDSRTATHQRHSIWILVHQCPLIGMRENDLLGPVLKGMYACWAAALVLAGAPTTDVRSLHLPWEGTFSAASSASCSVTCAVAVGGVIQRSCERNAAQACWHCSHMASAIPS